jgi:hypothetical protein
VLTSLGYGDKVQDRAIHFLPFCGCGDECANAALRERAPGQFALRRMVV